MRGPGATPLCDPHCCVQMEGLHLRVDRAAPPKAKGGTGTQYDPARSIFVGNLHFQTKVGSGGAGAGRARGR